MNSECMVFFGGKKCSLSLLNCLCFFFFFGENRFSLLKNCMLCCFVLAFTISSCCVWHLELGY